MGARESSEDRKGGEGESTDVERRFVTASSEKGEEKKGKEEEQEKSIV